MALKLRRVLRRLIEPPAPAEPEKEPEEPKIEELAPVPEAPAEVPIQVPQEVKAMRPEEEQDFEEEGDEDEEDEDSEEDEEDEESEEDEGEEPEEEGEEGEEEEEEGEEEPTQPEKYTVRKLLKQTQIGKDGRPYIKPVITTLPGGTFEEEPPGQTDIEAMFQPLYGGGDYLIINQRTGKVYKKIHFDGAEKDPNAESPIPPAPMPAPRAGEAAPAPQITPIDKLQLALASGQSKAVEELARLADRFTAEGNAEQLGKVVEALKEIATGKRAESAQDKFMEYIIADKNKTSEMLTTILLESRKTKQPDASDVVRDTLGIVKDMLAVSREIMPGEDQTVALAKEVTGAVKEGLKEVTDTVVKVTGSGELKAPPAEIPARQVFRCGRCGEEVKPHYRQCPNCGLIFRPGAVPKPPEVPPATETFAPTGPRPPPPPPIPVEVKARLGYLRKLALFIQENHDPEVKAGAIVKVATNEERKQLLFLAEFGYDNLMKMANPYRTSPEIPDREAIYKLVESGNGKLWINRFFKAIRKASTELGATLTDDERMTFIGAINQHSAVKFHIRKPQPPVKPTKEAPVTPEKSDHMTTCPICDALMDVKDLETHLFTNHPRPGQQRKVPPPVAEPLPQDRLTPEDEE